MPAGPGRTAHELAHQWFGDLVTTAWWDDIWLNEGFANWMENKITARLEPSWHTELEELDMRTHALDADALVSARQIRQPIEAPGDILNVFDGITYNKGASVLNMFESYVGTEPFRRGVRAYLQARAFGNATSADFVAAISKAAGKDLAPGVLDVPRSGGRTGARVHPDLPGRTEARARAAAPRPGRLAGAERGHAVDPVPCASRTTAAASARRRARCSTVRPASSRSRATRARAG